MKTFDEYVTIQIYNNDKKYKFTAYLFLRIKFEFDDTKLPIDFCYISPITKIRESIENSIIESIVSLNDKYKAKLRTMKKDELKEDLYQSSKFRINYGQYKEKTLITKFANTTLFFTANDKSLLPSYIEITLGCDDLSMVENSLEIFIMGVK